MTYKQDRLNNKIMKKRQKDLLIKEVFNEFNSFLIVVKIIVLKHMFLKRNITIKIHFVKVWQGNFKNIKTLLKYTI